MNANIQYHLSADALIRARQGFEGGKQTKKKREEAELRKWEFCRLRNVDGKTKLLLVVCKLFYSRHSLGVTAVRTD